MTNRKPLQFTCHLSFVIGHSQFVICHLSFVIVLVDAFPADAVARVFEVDAF
jgi:hypothetical protein